MKDTLYAAFRNMSICLIIITATLFIYNLTIRFIFS